MNTTIQKIYENNVRRQYSQSDEQEFSAAGKGLEAKRLDLVGPGTESNTNLIDEFFQKNRDLPVSVENIYRAVEARKGEFIWLSDAQAAWYQTSQQNRDLANQLAIFLATQGRPGQLANEGDSLFENLLLLFNEINAHPQPLAHAEDRIAHRPGKQLNRVPQPRRTEPVSRAAKEDDGEPFVTSGLTKQRDGSLGKSPADYAREAHEAAEKNNPQPKPGTPLSASDQTWKNMADGLSSDGTHSQQQRVRAVYDREQGNGWRQIYEACKREVNAYKNRGIR